MIIDNLIPGLRFSEFSKPLTKNKIREFSLVRSGSTPLRSITAYFKGGETPWVKTTDLNNGSIIRTEERVTELALSETSLRINPSNSVLIAMYGGFNQIGRTGILDKPAATNQALSVLNVDESCLVPKYLQHYLNAKVSRWRRFAASSRKDPNITSSDVGAFPVAYCGISEQQKIADFLSAVDTKISQLTEKHRLLKEYKKGVMQQLFSQQIRFKDDDGKAFPDWDFIKGDKVFKAVSNKKHDSDLPILAITQEHGAIPRELINYNVQVTDNSVSGYKVVDVGDFIISLRSFQGGIEYSNYKGICSPAYIILRPKLKIDDSFFKCYLKTHNFIQEMKKRLEGIRDGKILSYAYFSEISLPYPCFAEQQKIAQFLQSIDKRVDAVALQIEQTKLFKKGLLQQMFV